MPKATSGPNSMSGNAIGDFNQDIQKTQVGLPTKQVGLSADYSAANDKQSHLQVSQEAALTTAPRFRLRVGSPMEVATSQPWVRDRKSEGLGVLVSGFLDSSHLG